MALFLTQLMNGIGSGAVYVSIALALVLVFRTTGILNFAQGEMALYSTYLVWFFTQRSVPVWIAIVLAMIISFIGGALIERFLIRPVEKASPLVLVIVTIGMFLAINSIAEVQFGNDIKILPRAYPNKTWLPGNVQISSDTLVLVGVLLAECLILYLLLNRTRIGLAFRVRGVESRVEPARRRAGRAHADAGLGDGSRDRRARGCARHRAGRAAGREHAGDPRVLVRGRRARWIRQSARRGRGGTDRRSRGDDDDAVPARRARHRARRAVRAHPRSCCWCARPASSARSRVERV